jgi:hypothetical protein
MDRSFRCLVTALIVAGCYAPALRALEENDLKDETGKVIVHYFVEAPANVAHAGTSDPAKQVGVIVSLQEHTEVPSADIYPVRMSLKRLGLSDSYVLVAVKAQAASGCLGAADIEPIKKLVAWAQKTYPVNPAPHLCVWQRLWRKYGRSALDPALRSLRGQYLLRFWLDEHDLRA